MQKLFSHTFSQNIWRILPHPDANRNEWALELREISEKKVSFACIDLSKPALKWIAASDETDWWTSMTAFGENEVFLHHYRYPDLPEPTDLSALSASTGENLWVLPNYVLVQTLDSDKIEVARKTPDGFNYAMASANTGALLNDPERKQTTGEIILKQPVRYKKGNVYFEKLASFLQTNFNINNPVCIDYLDQRPYMVISYYIYDQDKIMEFLLILTDKKEVILHELLSQGREGVSRSTIMLKESTLVYLKNNNEFSSLTLS